jgi:diacylglycerol kinase (ATP)
MAKKNILFVINPLSGGKNKSHIPDLIEKHLDHNIYEYEICFTRDVDHAYKLSKSALYLGFDFIIAVGGDGTINEVGRSLIHKENGVLGIIPKGSGNGLARYLSIPLNDAKAIAALNKTHIVKMDSATCNDRPFFNVAGVGFDAQVSFSFANSKSRGLSNYVRSTFRELNNFKPESYKITVDGKVVESEGFMISIANGNQFGNNAFIAPHAKIDDGLLDISIIKPFPMYLFPKLAFDMMSKRVKDSKYVQLLKGKEVRIERSSEGPAHLDGEPLMMDKILQFKIHPLSISVLKP